MRRILFTGPMFAGKTTSLIKHSTDAAKKLGIPGVVFLRPETDNRFSKMKTHDDKYSVDAQYFYDAEHLLDILSLMQAVNPVVIAIDEIQFVHFTESQFIEFTNLSFPGGSMLFMAGLNRDHFGNKFPTIYQLLRVASFNMDLISLDFIHLYSSCGSCGAPAVHTQWISEEDYNDETRVGGSEKYDARCHHCFRAYDRC